MEKTTTVSANYRRLSRFFFLLDARISRIKISLKLCKPYRDSVYLWAVWNLTDYTSSLYYYYSPHQYFWCSLLSPGCVNFLRLSPAMDGYWRWKFVFFFSLSLRNFPFLFCSFFKYALNSTAHPSHSAERDLFPHRDPQPARELYAVPYSI